MSGDSLAGKLLRPEVTSLIGLAVAFAYFAIAGGDSGFLSSLGTRNWVEYGSELAIIAIPVALLMIAGEFDLTVGAVFGISGVIAAMSVVEYGLPLVVALLLVVVFAIIVGVINGLVVVKTGLPSFIVTLALSYVLSGIGLGVLRSLTDGGSEVNGINNSIGSAGLPSAFTGTVFGLNVGVVWMVAILLAATWLLYRTRFGNWIFGSGGDPVAARRAGIPVARVKVTLYVFTALAAALAGLISSFYIDAASVAAGQNKEFQAIVAAVIGGCALSGGIGSPFGGAVGALIFGMVSQGFFFTGIDSDWFQTFIGVMLLASVVINSFARQRALKASGS